MSRVKIGQKFVNTNKYDNTIIGISKKKRIHFEGEDYHKAKTLSNWLFTKYDMKYKTFKNKSKKKKDELRKEFIEDTKINLNNKNSQQD